jgi:hypothetical protein
LDELLEDEEDDKASRQAGVETERVPELVDRLGEQVKEGAAEERAGGQRHERKDDALELGLG